MKYRRRERLLLGLSALLGLWTAGCQSGGGGALGMRPSGLLEMMASKRESRPAAGLDRPRMIASSAKPAASLDVPVVRLASGEEMPGTPVSTGAWRGMPRAEGVQPIGNLDLTPEPVRLTPMPVARTQGRMESSPLPSPRRVLPAPGSSEIAMHGPMKAFQGMISGHHPHEAHVAPIHGVPREGMKAPLPPHVIEPPDIIIVQLFGREKEVRAGTVQRIDGAFLVHPDGGIILGKYGRVQVAGLTLEQAKSAIAATLLQEKNNLKKRKLDDGTEVPFEDDLVVDMEEFASKYCYLIADGGGNGASVVRIPINGSDTVLDALGKIGGLPPQAAKKKVWVARPGHHAGHGQLLPVDWAGIAQRGEPGTNYQLAHNDRIYIQSDPRIRVINQMDKTLDPIERTLGLTLLGSSVVNSIRDGGRNNNNNNNNNR